MIFDKKFDDLLYDHPELCAKVHRELEPVETEPRLSVPSQDLERYLKGFDRVQTKLAEDTLGAFRSTPDGHPKSRAGLWQRESETTLLQDLGLMDRVSSMEEGTERGGLKKPIFGGEVQPPLETSPISSQQNRKPFTIKKQPEKQVQFEATDETA